MWNDRPRRVVASGIVIGAASCTVTTSGTPSNGGTAGDGAWMRSTGATRLAGPARPSRCHGVVEHGPREWQHDGVDIAESVVRQRGVDGRAWVPSGERGHVRTGRAGREEAHERRGVTADPTGCRLQKLFDVHGDPHSPRTLP